MHVLWPVIISFVLKKAARGWARVALEGGGEASHHPQQLFIFSPH